MRSKCYALIVASLLLADGASAEVVDAAESGFTVRHEIEVIAPRETAWRMLVGHVGEWWHDDHTYSGDAANLFIEERPLGCFCERLSEDDAVVHLMVTVIQQNSLLRLTGGLGPLGLMGVNGNLTFSFDGDSTSTRIAMQYQVGGYSPDGLAEIAPAVDATLGAQLARYIRFVESGSPESGVPEAASPAVIESPPEDAQSEAQGDEVGDDDQPTSTTEIVDTESVGSGVSDGVNVPQSE
ncbi:MAG: ATPase [Pseudomonadota bacterium]